MGNKLSRVLSILIVTFVALVALSADVFPFLTTPSIHLNESHIESDLLKLHEKEKADATKHLKQGTPDEIREKIQSQFIQNLNAVTFENLKRYSISANVTEQVTQISEAQARKIHKLIKDHPIVSSKGSQAYDGRKQSIGYCFGRAAYVHAELIRHGVEPSSIVKVFVVGSLLYQNRIGWDFHVATLVRRTGGSWWAIDGLGDDVLELKPWIQNMMEMAQNPANPDLRFYLTDASKFNATPGAYTRSKLFASYYNNYFSDLIAWMLKHPVKTEDKFKIHELSLNGP